MLLATEALVSPGARWEVVSVSTVTSTASVLLAVSECRARLALLPRGWLHFCLKYNPGFGGVAWVRVPSGSP